MYDYTPLIIIAITFGLLWALGQFLSRKQKPAEPTSETKNVRGSMVMPGLNVIGLNDETIEELRTLINAPDQEKLSVFLAIKKPTFIELENYITALREQFLERLNRPIKMASEIEKIAATNNMELINPPRGYDFNTISKDTLRILLEYDVRKRRVIGQDFITRFGEADFMKNFETYAELSGDGPVTMLVARGEKHRSQLENFVETGIALQGRKIPLQDRLGVLRFTQLREMGQELKLETEFKRRSDATSALAEIPGSAILLAMLVNVDDIFLIKREPFENRQVQSEWTVIKTISELLCTKRNRE